MSIVFCIFLSLSLFRSLSNGRTVWAVVCLTGRAIRVSKRCRYTSLGMWLVNIKKWRLRVQGKGEKMAQGSVLKKVIGEDDPFKNQNWPLYWHTYEYLPGVRIRCRKKAKKIL